jgi:hypothetical protein
MIVPNSNIMSRELRETRKRSQGVEIVIEDGDFHGLALTVDPTDCGSTARLSHKRAYIPKLALPHPN